MKPKNYKTITLEEYYDFALKACRHIALEHGYAVAVHGTMKTDLDLVAVPWVSKAIHPKTLANKFLKILGGEKNALWDTEVRSVHGHLKYTIILPLDFEYGKTPYIDLTIIPPKRQKKRK